MTDPSIAVVVPTVDRPDHLRRCLSALAGGTLLPDEVVVVDQGDRERTEEVLTDAALSSLPVQHVVAPLRGLSAARNVGLARVTSAWVAYTDDDCVPSDTWLEAILDRASASDAPDGVLGRVLPVGEGDEGHTLSLRVSTTPQRFRGRAYPWRVGTGGNTALRAAALREAGGYDERLGAGTPGWAGEDLEVVHRLLRRGHLLAFEPAVLVRHDRVPAERRLASRRSYGFGMGAYVGLWCREDPWVLRPLGRWTFQRARRLLRAARRRDRWGAREEWLLLRGLVSGVRYGWGLRRPVGGGPGAS